MFIETQEELDAVTPETVVMSSSGTIAVRHYNGEGVLFGINRFFPWDDLALPVQILHHPDYDVLKNAKADGWAEGFEACYEWTEQNPPPSGIWNDPPFNPYEDKV